MFVDNREPDPYNIGMKILENTVSLFSTFYIFRNLTGVILANILKINHVLKSFSNSTIISGG